MRCCDSCRNHGEVLNISLSVCLADVVEEYVSVGPEKVSALEEFIPTRQTSVTLMRARITVPAAEYNLLHVILPALLRQKVHTHTLSVYVYAHVSVCLMRVFPQGVDCTDLCASVPALATSACAAAAVWACHLWTFCTHVWRRSDTCGQQPKPAIRNPPAQLLHTLLPKGTLTHTIQILTVFY